MTRRRSTLAALLLAATMLHPPHAQAFGDTTVTGAPCGITANGQANNNNIYCGLTPEQVALLIQAAVTGATAEHRQKITELSNSLKISEDAAWSVLRIVGKEEGIPREKLGEVLNSVAQDYKRLLAQAAALNPDNPTAKALVDKARMEIDAGRFKEARELLRQATTAQVAAAQQARALAEQARAAEEVQLLGAAESTALAGDVALTQREYLAAADLFRQAADLLPPGREEDRLEYLDREAEAFFRQGDERGDNAALLTAIEHYEDLLRLRPRDKSPNAWAMTQNDLGNALVRLGERESAPARLEQAVQAFNAALQERTRERTPLYWAMSQNNLGNALVGLGERESDPTRLEQAVKAYQDALQELTRERSPLNWAATMNNLGGAFARLGDPMRLEQAVEAFNAALLEYTRERAPLNWAMTQNNLGEALRILGEQESNPARLEQAVGAYSAALLEYTRERVPLQWAKTQNNLGAALSSLGERQSDPTRLEQAVEAYNAALLEYTRERVPLQWANTQNNLSISLWAIFDLDGDMEKLPAVLTAWRSAAEVFRQAGMLHVAEPLEGNVRKLEVMLAAATK